MSIDDMDWSIKEILVGNNPISIHTKQHLVKPLTQKQYDFAVNYVKNGFNAHQAAIDAGYTKSTAQTHNILSNPGVQQIVDKAYQKVEKKIVNTLGITFMWKLKRLKEVVEQYIPIDGTEFKGRSTDVKVGLQALSEMNKMMGDYAPDKRLNLTVDATSSKMKEVRKIYEDY